MTAIVLDRYRRALNEVDNIVARVEDDRWDFMSPCPPWTARAVLGHLIDGQQQVAALLTGQGPRPPHADPDALADTAPAAAWQAAHRDIERVLAKVSTPPHSKRPRWVRAASPTF
ncbi:maleylpyruvate isomerase N-terminal domain-containing protein [Frankia sp. Cas4]|uniref:maleylpyruvate isomerase N-terminal domain-containing protein n=1 Tax=Frankia sp. Cas4 TaxID=3073927 RepID=UPI002AD3EDB1|nr:maleylpyruvate isomerase N-terminal domain-containing protein [Frankia sp. Cas4]